MSDFNWHGGDDAESIILQYQPPVAVYSSKGRNVIIRQKAEEFEEYDSTIHLTPQGALAIAWALIEEANLVGLPEPSPSLMVESPNWPPVTKRFDDPQKEHEKRAVAKADAEDKAEEPALLAAMRNAAE